MSWRLWVPLFVFALFVGLAAYQLTQPKDDFVESRMVGEELPYFDLPPAMEGAGLSFVDSGSYVWYKHADLAWAPCKVIKGGTNGQMVQQAIVTINLLLRVPPFDTVFIDLPEWEVMPFETGLRREMRSPSR